MAPPLVTIYVTSLTSAPKVRKMTELLHRALRGFEIPYEAYDLVNDEDAKRRWQRAKPEGMVIGLPGFLVGGEWIGTMEDFEDAVETQTLETFLRQDMELADASQTIGEAELDRLMREMTDEDLDSLVGHLSVNDVPAEDLAASPTAATTSALAAPGASASAAPVLPPISAPSPLTASATLPLSSKDTSTADRTADPTTPTKQTQPLAPESKSKFKSDAAAAADAEPTGVLATASATLVSAAAAVTETAKEGVEALKVAAEHVAEEPASVTAKRPEVEEQEDKGESPAQVAAEDVQEETLDDVIDKTLAREAVEEEKKEEEGKKEGKEGKEKAE